MNSIANSDKLNDALGVPDNLSQFDLDAPSKLLAIEYQPEGLDDKGSTSGQGSKRIREVDDMLSNPPTKRKYDEFGNLYEATSKPKEDNAPKTNEEKLEAAFKQLSQGKYPSLIEKRKKKIEEFDEITRDFPEKAFDDVKSSKAPAESGPPLSNFPNIAAVESVRQKTYLDELWRKITKTEHVVIHFTGQRFKILTKKIQTAEGRVKYRQKITPM